LALSHAKVYRVEAEAKGMSAQERLVCFGQYFSAARSTVCLR